MEADLWHILIMMGISFSLVTGLMLLLWVVYVIQRNASILDIGWGVGFVLTALVYYALGEGDIWRKLLVLILVSAWGLRLVFHLIERFSIPHTSRYQSAFQSFQDWGLLKTLGVFLIQALLIVILSLPFALMSQNRLLFFSVWEVFGLLLWMAGFVGESIADRQMMEFKQDPANRNKVFEKGLWKYSRHPNYFFEWMIWIAYAMMALPAEGGWLALISPLLLLVMLLSISKPLNEAQALKTKGEAYHDYQQNTSSFIPWFRWPLW